MKTMAMALGLMLALGVSEARANEPLTKVQCKVTKVTPVNANFFNIIPRGPRVGGTIDLDLTAKEITDLTFSSGEIGIRRVGAKLVRNETYPPGSGYTYYDGTYRSSTSDYTGVLYAYDDGNTAQATIQVARKQFTGPIEVNQLDMTCSRIP